MQTLKSVAHGERVLLTSRVFVFSKSVHGIFPLTFNVFASPLQMISERGFPLLKRYTLLIGRMIDAGITVKLYSDFYFNMTILEHIRHHSEEIEPTQIVLTLNHMDGAFNLLCLGLMISSIVFFLEMLVNFYRRRQNSRSRWKLLPNTWFSVTILQKAQTKENRKPKIDKNKKKISSKKGKQLKINTSKNKIHYLP